MALGGLRRTTCALREHLLQRLCLAAQEHADVARGLDQFVGQHPGFREAEANVCQRWRIVLDLRDNYDEHRREHGC
jgi:hypothetical protein